MTIKLLAVIVHLHVTTGFVRANGVCVSSTKQAAWYICSGTMKVLMLLGAFVHFTMAFSNEGM